MTTHDDMRARAIARLEAQMAAAAGLLMLETLTPYTRSFLEYTRRAKMLELAELRGETGYEMESNP